MLTVYPARRLIRRAVALGCTLLAITGLAACDDTSAPKSPLVIGLITNNNNGLGNVHGFRQSLIDHGSVDGRDISFVTPRRPVHGADLEKTLKNFVESGVDLIFTAGTPTGVAAHRITRDSGIPVVFGVVADPIRAGLMTDLARPGGNMTGVSLYNNQARRLELFLQVIPNIKTIAILYNPNDAAPTSAVAQLESAAATLNIKLQKHPSPDNAAVSAALAAISPDVDAIFLVPDSVVNKRIKDVIALSFERNLPVSGPSMAQMNQGALMTYGFVHMEVGAQAARIALQILKGSVPGDIPVQTAEAYLGFNLKTAGRIGVAIPQHFLESALLIDRLEN